MLSQNQEIQQPQPQPPKRKRGRPRKIKDVTEVKKLQKRGRKKKIEKQTISLNNLEEIEIKTKKIQMKSIIVHLPFDIQSFEEKDNAIFENDFLSYTPNDIINGEPTGFDLSMDNSLLSAMPEEIKQEELKTEQIEYKIINKDKPIIKKINNILLDFKSFNNKKFMSTNVCCWHCCHKFENMPCGIPISYEEELFNVKGIFCSFNCALTYNYDSNETENVIQERESLLYLLYKKIHNVKKIELNYAPEKETLQMFGGTLTIEEFRKNNNIYKMIYPPMLSIIPQLEEIKNFNSLNNVADLTIKKEKTSKLDKFFKKC